MMDLLFWVASPGTGMVHHRFFATPSPPTASCHYLGPNLGVKLSKDAMQALERCFIRDPHLGGWFVTISPDLLAG
jgi:hypothetical protein